MSKVPRYDESSGSCIDAVLQDELCSPLSPPRVPHSRASASLYGTIIPPRSFAIGPSRKDILLLELHAAMSATQILHTQETHAFETCFFTGVFLISFALTSSLASFAASLVSVAALRFFLFSLTVLSSSESLSRIPSLPTEGFDPPSAFFALPLLA